MPVFHVDSNSAYLSWTAVRMLEEGSDVDIRDIPSAIAGDPANRHGIILAKSIPAKKAGVKTGESIMEAMNKCPTLTVYPPYYDHFLLCSDAMYDILCRYTGRIERYSVDECFMDMGHVRRSDAYDAGVEIKNRIKEELGFTVNVGIGPNKLLAKMAGELKKPDIVETIWENEIRDKLWPLPVRELFMVGRASERKLKALNIYTVGELAKCDVNILTAVMKSHGRLIHNYANGIDFDPVVPNDEVIQKGLGNSMTFSYDLVTRDEVHAELLALCERVGMRLRRMGRKASLVSVHIRYSDLYGKGRQRKLSEYICTTKELFDAAAEIADELWDGNPIRQMGVSAREFSSPDVQMSMFEARDKEEWEKIDSAVDKIRKRYGDTSIIRGTFANTGIKPIEGGVNDGDYLMMGGYRQ